MSRPIDGKVFFDDVATPQESKIMNNVTGDNLKLQVSCQGVFALQVLGKIDNEATDFEPMTIFNDNGIVQLDQITNKGCYTISTQGYTAIKLNLVSVTSPLRAFGKVVSE